MQSSETQIIEPFEGERAITTMPIYPTRFHVDMPGEVSMRERVVERGKKFMRLMNVSHRDYNGLLINEARRRYNGRVMIDNTMRPWEEMGMGGDRAVQDPSNKNTGRLNSCTCDSCIDMLDKPLPSNSSLPFSNEYETLALDAVRTDDHYFLCSHYVYGYLLTERRWGKI